MVEEVQLELEIGSAEARLGGGELVDARRAVEEVLLRLPPLPVEDAKRRARRHVEAAIPHPSNILLPEPICPLTFSSSFVTVCTSRHPLEGTKPGEPGPNAFELSG
ncbi:MAG TPA: hypothetical protein VM580_05370 [Labilithrix sp.]|nr:hypothetical protein [Labilithrix sp.]